MGRMSLWVGAIPAGVVGATAVSWSVADPVGGWDTWRVALAAWPFALVLGAFMALMMEVSK